MAAAPVYAIGTTAREDQMTNPSTGRFTWHEIMTTDVSAAVTFYTSLLGWRTEVMDMGPAGKYTLFLAGQTGVGGCMSAQPGVPSNWLVYVGSDDVDATMARVAELGGKVLVPPTDIPSMVRFSIATDPQGAAFGVVKNLDPKNDVPPPDGAPAPGTFCWDELHTSDQEAAGKFYGKVFGWTGKLGDNDPMKYWHWKNGDKDIGGMMTLQMPGVPPHWLAYIATADVDAMIARAKELGAKVLMEPMEIEKVGRFGVVQDPTGAAFALFRSARV
jgi:uncharacterized protein